MAANMVSGAHGRDISAAEASWSSQVATPFSGSRGQITFADVLDALNPLQFLPVVGTVYRVITGDQGSSTLRTAVSMVAGAVLGGPIGLLTSIGSSLFEHFFPFEQMAHAALVPPDATMAKAAAAPAAPPALPAAAQTSGQDVSSGPAAAPPVLTAQAVLQAAAPEAAPPPTPLVAAQAVAAYDRADAMAERLAWGGREH